MADFCNGCAEKLGLPIGDFAGMTTLDDLKNGKAAEVLCEGCGEMILVDEVGNRIVKERKASG